MYGYINGRVTYVTSNYIILDNNGIGYILYVGNPYTYEENKEYKVYTYNFISENENSLYGFISNEEKDFFLKLINVKGLGPKTALPMLAMGSISGIADAIERENILYLKKFPKVGEKLAKQIILDLKGKLNVVKCEDSLDDDLILVLENLGYKTADIKRVLPLVNKELKLEDQIKEALKQILK